MKAALARAALVVLLLPSASGAHRLDEYLQASRLAVTREAVVVEVDLTPGVAVARAIVTRIDRNGDGTIAPHEAEAYGREVVADLTLTVNGQASPLVLSAVESPSPAEMLDGVGRLSLRARAPVAGGSSARLDVRFRNDHAPAGSVYLANALKPRDRAMVLARQTRDAGQREIALDYHLRPAGSAPIVWSGLAVILVVGLTWTRTVRQPLGG